MAMKKAKKGPIDYQQGASKKAIAAQGARGNAQAVSEIKKKKKGVAVGARLQAQKDADTKARAAKTNAARFKPIKGKKGEYVSTAWKKNQTKKSKFGDMEMLGAMFSPNASVKDTTTGPKGKRKSELYIRGTYKGKGSK